jgi:hypothetical protein
MLPAMTPEELLALSNDIRSHGLQERIKLIRYGASYAVLDGRSRLDALEMIAPITVFEGTRPNRHFFEVVDLKIDPVTFVVSMNLHRRHLTAEQKRELVAKVLKAQPELSDKAIASTTKVSDKTIGAVRRKLQAGAEIPHHQSRVGKNGVKQPSAKPARKRRSPASNSGRKTPSPVIDTSYDEIEPGLPFELPQARSVAQKALSATKAEIIPQPDPIVIHRAAIRGAVIGVAKITNIDFDRVATLMPIDQLQAARAELDKAAQVIGNWRDALDAAIDRASLIQAVPPPEQICQEELPPRMSEHDGVR